MMTPKLIKSTQAFSLIELIIVVVLLGVMASAGSYFILKPVEAYIDIERRQELVDSAEMAVRRISRDIHNALPNSLRISSDSTRSTLEIINIADGARYRDETGTSHNTSTDRLSFNPSGDDEFNIFNTFKALSNGTTLPSNHRLVIYNTSDDVYSAGSSNDFKSIITPATTTISLSTDDTPDEQKITLSTAHQFEYESPSQRIYVVNGTIVYICDENTNTLTRYAGNTYTAIQANADEDSELSGYNSALVTQNVSSCNFSYDAGTSTRSGLVTLQISLSKDNETINLQHEVHVVNVP